MPSLGQFLAFALTAFILIVIPGPAVLFTIGRALTLGRRGALLSIAGNASGCYVQIIAVAFGVGALVQRSSEVYLVVKYAGAAYLVYLGVRAFRRRHELGDAVTGVATAGRSSVRQLMDGFVVGITNPKTIIFFTVAMPQFTNESAGHVPAQILVLGVLFPAIALVSDSVWAVIAATARGWFARSPRRIAAVGGAGGVAIAGLGVTVAVSGRAD